MSEQAAARELVSELVDPCKQDTRAEGDRRELPEESDRDLLGVEVSLVHHGESRIEGEGQEEHCDPHLAHREVDEPLL